MEQSQKSGNKTKRLLAFDLLKVFAIYMVLWGHCIQYLLSSPYMEDAVYRYIYSFHMPLFMMIAGFFSYNSLNKNFRHFLTKKVRELILPIITWGIIFFVINSIVQLREGKSIYFFYDLKAILLKNLWFLKSLFVCYLLAYLVHRKQSLLWTIITILLSQFIVTHNICTMYPSFLVGLYLNKHLSLLNNKILLSISVSIFLFMIYFWDSSFWIPESVWPTPNMLETFYTGDMIYIYHYIDKGIYRLVIGLSGSLALITIFNITFEKNKNRFTEFLSVWGQYTLGIYILQFFILESYMSKILKCDNYDYCTFHFLICPIISVVLLILLTHITKFTYKYKSIAYIFWGKK